MFFYSTYVMLHVVSTDFHLYHHPFPYVNEIQPYITVFVAKNRKPQPPDNGGGGGAAVHTWIIVL